MEDCKLQIANWRLEIGNWELQIARAGGARRDLQFAFFNLQSAILAQRCHRPQRCAPSNPQIQTSDLFRTARPPVAALC
jgi:hypothetical protein